MSKQFFRLALTLVLLLSMTAIASAQTQLPGNGWFTTTTIQNVDNSTEDATVTLQVYSGQGQTVQSASATFSLPKGQNKVFVPGSGQSGTGSVVDVTPQLSGPFSGSMVVLSDKQIVAIGQLGNNVPPGTSGLGTTGGYANAFYRGTSTSTSTVTYPVVKNNWAGKTTVFSIQAVGGNVSYTATIRSNSGATHTKSGSIDANRSLILAPSDFTPAMPSTNCGSDVNTSPCFGSISVSATGGTLAGAAIEYRVGQSPAKEAQSAAMFSSNDAAQTVYCPTIKSAYTPAQNRTTGMTVANVTNSNVTVNVVFTVSVGPGGKGTTYTVNNVPVPANRSVNFSKFDGNLGGMPDGTLAAAKVTSSAPNSIVAVVNESNPGGNPIKSTTYTCFGEQTATQRVAAPLVKKNLGGSTSGPTVQNVNPTGGASIQVEATYVCGGTTYTSASVPALRSPSLAPGESYTFFNPAGVPDSALCAVTLDAGASNKIIAVVQETSDFAGSSPANLLDTKNYEGFNLSGSN